MCIAADVPLRACRWAFHLPTMIISVPHSLIESAVWSGIVYWVRLKPSIC